MQAQFSLSDIERIKRELAALLPAVKSSHRVEAMARGLGWNTNAALRAELAGIEMERPVDDRVFTTYLKDHGFTETWFGSLSEAVVRCKFTAERDAIKLVLSQQTTLTRYGLGIFEPWRKTREQRKAELIEGREAMLLPYHMGEFIRARDFLSQFTQRATINTKISSYGLKDQAEAFYRERNAYNSYISNGLFIAAAIHLGFKIKQVGDSPNLYFNLGSKHGNTAPVVHTPPGGRLAAWRNLMIAAINAGLDLNLFGLAPEDNRWTGDGTTYRFTFAGMPAIAYVRDVGYGELKFQAAVNPTEDAAEWIDTGNAGFLAGDAFAAGWLGRQQDAWLQINTRPMCTFRRHILPTIAQTNIKPKGYLPKGKFMM
jgi:hypothetical protein